MDSVTRSVAAASCLSTTVRASEARVSCPAVRAIDCVTSLQRWAKRDSFGQTMARNVDAWEAADDRTIRIRLKHPFPRLLDGLAKPVTPPYVMPARIAATPASIAVAVTLKGSRTRSSASTTWAGA